MALLSVPISSVNSEIFTITLSQTAYRAKFNWIDKNSGWYMDLYEVNGAPLFLGHKLNYNSPINSKYFYLDNSPDGYLILVDTTNQREVPSFDSISTTDRFYYFTPDEA